MSLLRFLLKSSGKMTLLIVLTGTLASGFNAGLIAAVHRALTGPSGFSTGAVFAFGALLLGKLISGYVAGFLLDRHGHTTINALRLQLVSKLMTVPFARLQALGTPKVLTTLTEDLSRLQGALQALAATIVSGAIVAGGAAYLVYLSPRLFLWAATLGGIAVVLHLSLHRSGRRWFKRARELSDTLFEHYRDITSGLRELKLNRTRRSTLLERGLSQTTAALMDTRLRAQARYLQSQATTQAMLFVGVFLLLLEASGQPAETTGARAVATGYVLTALYLIGPLTGVLRSLPIFGMAAISLEQLHAIGAALDAPDAEPESEAPPPTRFDRIELCAVEFAHPNFHLGPVDMSIEPGQVTFITGENGSGKSTLGLLLCGLYAPTAGCLQLDGERVDAHGRDRYRQLVSAVFFDFHPFDRLWRPGADAPPAGAAWLARLGLSGKLGFDGDRVSSDQLSHGQRRRLALAMALCEDRPLLLFDEFGADQSPEFKRWFYRELLPELRALGKAVVVMTHDDRFFDLADQRIALADGKPVPVA